MKTIIFMLTHMAGYEGESGEGFETLLPGAIGAAVGMPAAIAGIFLWAIGGNRKSRAELALKKFDLVPKNSMVPGLGIIFKVLTDIEHYLEEPSTLGNHPGAF